jgi:hypothetical protein
MKTKYSIPTIEKVKTQEKNRRSDLELHCSFFKSFVADKCKERAIEDVTNLQNQGDRTNVTR